MIDDESGPAEEIDRTAAAIVAGCRRCAIVWTEQFA